jgi:hypothetical protein
MTDWASAKVLPPMAAGIGPFRLGPIWDGSFAGILAPSLSPRILRSLIERLNLNCSCLPIRWLSDHIFLQSPLGCGFARSGRRFNSCRAHQASQDLPASAVLFDRVELPNVRISVVYIRTQCLVPWLCLRAVRIDRSICPLRVQYCGTLIP